MINGRSYVSISSPTELHREAFSCGSSYGDYLMEELVNHRAFTPISVVGFLAGSVLHNLSGVIMIDSKLLEGVQSVINKGTAYYMNDIKLGITKVDDYFNNKEFISGLNKLIEDFGGYDGSQPVSLIQEVPQNDFISLIYNTDARWTDYNRTALAKITPYLLPAFVPIETITLEVFPPYRQYTLFRQASDEHSKRVSASVFNANGRFYSSWIPFMKKYGPAYNTEGFLSRMSKISDMLASEAKTAVKNIGS